jgi:signal transduction histidine kinase
VSLLDELDDFLVSVREGSVPDLRLSSAVLAGHTRQLEQWFSRHADRAKTWGHGWTDRYSEWLRRYRQGLVEAMYEHVALYFSGAPEPLAELVELALATLVDEEDNIFPTGALAEERLGPIRSQTLIHAADLAAHSYKRRIARRGPSARQLARHLGLVHTRSDLLKLASTGELTLQLPRRERVRWALALDLARGQGLQASEQIEHDLASRLLQRGHVTLNGQATTFLAVLAQGREYEERLCLDRWTALGVLKYLAEDPLANTEYAGSQPPDEVYTLTDDGRALLTELLAERPHPLRELARTLREDEAAGVPSGVTSALTSPGSSGRGLTRYTHIVTHEVRNALLPVQLAANHLARQLDGTDLAATTAASRATIDAGLARVFEFVDDWLQVAEQMGEPSVPFDVLEAVRDAVAALSPELKHPVSLLFSQGTDATVLGERALLTRSIAELLRNSVQAKGNDVKIVVTMVAEGSVVNIGVRDDGPGVAEGDRERIFQRGVTTRPGGTGHGLSLIREALGTMAGQIKVDDGPGGGAHFIITLPLHQPGSQ